MLFTQAFKYKLGITGVSGILCSGKMSKKALMLAKKTPEFTLKDVK